MQQAEAKIQEADFASVNAGKDPCIKGTMPFASAVSTSALCSRSSHIARSYPPSIACNTVPVLPSALYDSPTETQTVLLDSAAP